MSDKQPRSPRRHKVLHIINGEDYSGAEYIQDVLGLRLRHHDYDVSFACLKPNRFESARLCQDIPLFRIPMRSRIDLRPVLTVITLLERERFSLVHTHCSRTAMIGRIASAISGRPMVHHSHGPTLNFGPTLRRGQTNALIERTSLMQVSSVIAVSNTTREYLRSQRIPDHVISVIPNGVIAPTTRSGRTRPKKEWTIGIIAMFRARKGLDVLLRATKLLKSKGHQVRLRAIGRFQTAADERDSKKVASDLGLSDIDWVGFSDDVYRELETIDIFVQPSVVAEGLPIALLQAMASETCVIGSNVDGITDAIRDGIDGLLTSPGNARHLAETITSVITGEVDWNDLRLAARKRQVEHFSDTLMTTRVAQVYSEVLS